jgi:hypothetical protein
MLADKTMLRSIDPMSFRARVLTGVWTLFLILVLGGVHGSSIAALAENLEPGQPRRDFALTPIQRTLALATGGDGDSFRTPCHTQARRIRSDEYLLWTPYALSQLNHRPRFPIVNELLPGGQNMLLIWTVPVAHVSLPARPATWGYFLFGGARGLAWQWWFPPFACFTILWLLFEIVLDGHTRLAGFGAFWFCASAHTVAWSMLPAYVTFFAALSCVCAYHVCTTQRSCIAWPNAVFLGVALAGFVLVLYPPWQVVLAYVFGAIFAGLLLRRRRVDRPNLSKRSRILAVSAAVVIAMALVGAWAVDSRDALRAMAESVYPGQRVCLGGKYPPIRWFSGWFNLVTFYGGADASGALPGRWRNQCEAASFYHFYPAVILSLMLIPRIRRAASATTWLLVALVPGLAVFCLVGFPDWLAKATLLSRTFEWRCDLAFGLISIVVSLDLLRGGRIPAASDGWYDRLATVAVALAMAGLCVCMGEVTRREVGDLLGWSFVGLAATGVGVASYALVAGRRRLFGGLVGSAVVATGFFFNPLALGLHSLRDLDLARQVARCNHEAPGGPPFWVCYGPLNSGVVVSALGGRTLTPVPFHPVNVWRELDPRGEDAQYYNRHAHFRLIPKSSNPAFRFADRSKMLVEVSATWDHPAFLRRGVHYVLVESGNYPAIQDDLRLRPLNCNLRYGHTVYEVAGSGW